MEEHASDVVEQEARIEELVVKLDIIGNSLSDLHLPASGPKEDASSDDESQEFNMVAGMDAATLRTVLWGVVDALTDLEAQRRSLTETVRRKEAEAQAAEAKRARLEKQNSDLKQGFHQRLSLLHSERIEYAQAICSPVGKKHGKEPSALRAMNADLEEKLELESQNRAALEDQVHFLRQQKSMTEERLQVVEAALESANPGSTNEVET